MRSTRPRIGPAELTTGRNLGVHDRRCRERHSGDAPRDLGLERVRVGLPLSHPARVLDATLTRREYYLYRYGEVVA